MMLGMLAEKGHTFTDDEAEAEAAVINTCCFIGDAKEESINTILEMAELKKSGQLKALIVAGCLAQRYKDEIQTEIPEVDEILGTMAIDAVTAAIDEVSAGEKHNHITDPDAALVYGKHRQRHYRRPFCLSENCGGLRQTLHLLHYPKGAGQLPQRPHGSAGKGSAGTG